MANNKKLPKHQKTKIKKTLNVNETLGSVKNEFLRFRFDLLDDMDQWCLGSIKSEDLHLLLTKMKHFESMRVKEIFHAGEEPGKSYSMESIIKPAQERMRSRQLDDVDSIQRLNIGGAKRLYGLLKGKEFSVIWWDPKHEICPSPLKHT